MGGTRLSELMIDFKSLIPLSGSEEGARVLFERLVVALMRLRHRDAHNLRPKQGDWGIDCFSGSLAGGTVIVWQAKYFLNGLGEAQKGNIRDSFKALVEASNTHGFRVAYWTLCLPIALSPNEMKWWEQWKKRETLSTGIRIELLDEDGLRELLSTRDAEHLRLGTFGPHPTWIQYFAEILHSGGERELFELPDPGLFEDATFIRQLRVAMIGEVTAAKTAFFNAELLAQEVTDKGDAGELKELKGLVEKVRSLWETRFNDNYSYANPSSPASFYSSVMRAIEEQSEANLGSKLTTATFVHKQGIGHQLADRCSIGWVPNFRDLFMRKQGETA